MEGIVVLSCLSSKHDNKLLQFWSTMVLPLKRFLSARPLVLDAWVHQRLGSKICRTNDHLRCVLILFKGVFHFFLSCFLFSQRSNYFYKWFDKSIILPPLIDTYHHHPIDFIWPFIFLHASLFFFFSESTKQWSETPLTDSLHLREGLTNIFIKKSRYLINKKGLSALKEMDASYAINDLLE